jgi:hypothetical protein
MSLKKNKQNKNVKQVLSGGAGSSGRWEDIKKGCKMVNVVEIHTHA